MRICIDLTPAIQGHAGIGRYAEEMARALVELGSDDDLQLFYTDTGQRTPKPPLDRLPRRVLPWPNKPWRLIVLLHTFLRLRMDRWLGGVDIFHATDHLLPPLGRTGSVLTVYDLTFITQPETHRALNRSFTTLMMPRFLRAADAVVAISESTRRDIERYYPFAGLRTSVVHMGVSSRFRPASTEAMASARRKYALPGRFFLYVGTIEPRKNLVTLFEAFKRAELPDMNLVIAGRKGWLYDETLARLRAMGLEQVVRFTGFVPDEDLPALYSLAEAFVFPSLYEGFGLPVLEAAACGTPVLCSNTSSLPEVVGDAALLLPPDDVRSWGEGLVQIAQEPALRADLSQRGRRQAARFSWHTAAGQMRELYREVYARRH
jgi:glycosyltransferase involved in cell wall biosynthesis